MMLTQTTSMPSFRHRAAAAVPVQMPRARLSSSTPHVTRAVSQPSTAQAATAEPLKLWLTTKDVERTVTMDVVAEGKGQAVIVVEVEAGSAAAQAGIVRGQRLVAISDPVRDNEVWDMGDRPSLRFVRDTLRMRRQGQVQLVLRDYLNVTDPDWATPSPAQTPQASDSTLGMAGASMDDGSSLPRNITASFLSEGEEEGGTMTVGERMALQYEARQRAAKQMTDVKKRIAKRAAYMDEVSQRNDSPLVAGLALAFLGPALIILGVAAGTGYLDHLYSASLTIN